MASRKQLEARAKRKGFKLTITSYSAELVAPAGKTFDGYHSVVDYFTDGKVEAWNYLYFLCGKLEDCPYENCCQREDAN